MKRPRRDHLYLLLCSSIILAASLIGVGYYRLEAGAGYPLDDSWIHLTFARNLADGAGFGANPGEATPGATSPLWVLLLSIGFLAGADHTVWPWLLAAGFLGAAGIASGHLFLALERESPGERSGRFPWPALLCGLVVSSTAPLIWSAAGAMEVPLFGALVCATLASLSRARDGRLGEAAICGGLTGLAALARPEGLLLAPIMIGVFLSRRSPRAVRSAAVGALACVVVYGPSVAFCLTTSGRWFPNTFYAKTTSLIAQAPDAGFLGAVIRFFLQVSPVCLLLFLCGVAGAGLAAWKRRPIHGLAAACAFVVGLPLAYSMMGRTYLFAELAGNYGRYLYPVIPPSFAVGFWGLGYLARSIARWDLRKPALLAMVVALGFTWAGAARYSVLYVLNVRDINRMQVAMAESLRERLPPGSLVAANDVGALAYLTDFRVLDLIGIISTPTLDALERAAPGPEGRDEAYVDLLLEERPVALVVFPGWFENVLRRFQPALQLVEMIDNPENITSGGSRLVAARIHWELVEDQAVEARE
jgi:hypothetical protein